MIRIVFITLICTTAAFCFGQSQTEMNLQAIEQCKKADKQLNSVYQKILSEYKEDTAFIKNLKAAQRRWIEFRDAEMKAKFPEQGSYGSMEPMCWSMYRQELIEERTKHLKQWLNGTEEGDGCSGSVKVKR